MTAALCSDIVLCLSLPSLCCLQTGADLEPETDKAWTPLQSAAFYGYDNIMRTLLDAGMHENTLCACSI